MDAQDELASRTNKRVHVILAAAQAAAEEIRRVARDDAAEVRRAADSYAEAKRREAGVEAGSILAAAAQRAELLEADASRRRDGLVDEARAIEERRQSVDPKSSLDKALRPDGRTRNPAT